MIAKLTDITGRFWNWQTMFLNKGSSGFNFFSKSDKRFFNGLSCSINIQMVGIHRTNHSDVRMKFQKTPVVFIRFNNTDIIFITPEVSIVIDRYPSQKRIGTHTAVSENMRYHRTYCSFSVSSGDANV